jgi:hypothetical protein
VAWLLHHIQVSSALAFTRARGLLGLDGLLAFWAAHAELCSTIVERLALPRLVREGGPGDWRERPRRICEFVGVAFEDDPLVDPADIGRLTGRYADGKRQATVEVVDGRLALRGVLWFTNALLPVTRTVFDVESWPLRLVFEDGAKEPAPAFRCEGPRLAGGPWGIFTRQAE